MLKLKQSQTKKSSPLATSSVFQLHSIHQLSCPTTLCKCIKPFCVSIPRLDEDPNRFPQVIADAKCRLSGCVNPLGQEDHSFNSVPIQQEILVLRREQEGCLPTYRLEKKVITVGCTCAAPVIHHQS
uniref:Interleukin-17F n=1 Tax=Otus sunia TaxID=257818 RepID=A0A8C8ANZ7_9STRI